MDSLDYKLSDAEKKDLISSCCIKGSGSYHLNEINPLPYGYIFHFKDKEGYGSSFVVNISHNSDKKKVDVAPDCNFAGNLKKFLENYFNQEELLL